ncbi:nitrite reductase small subunit NirD [Phycicoccus flavus]|uniref:nitrite reductase small subunit NirD n=1 Tax=Phycicoccus flavus TaxID=2502783 RepID=UPI000FEBB872|nr:nitrite reductase small subunit NirD [Phycicoccus flavus]NHA69020.1 nitrite reductase small subunit NirD [Phycicoccus flavus]
MTAVAARPGLVDLCALDRLVPDLGVAALVGDEQVAVFRLADGSVHAVGNLDPYSGAAVMSRGITGSRGEVPTIASPVYKQVFSLVDGQCLDAVGMDPRPGRGPDLPVYGVRVDHGRVLLDPRPVR